MKHPTDPNSIRLLSSAIGLVMLMLFQASCQMKVMQPTSGDQVRERVAALQDRTQELEDENAGLKARLEELTQAQDPEIRTTGAATPRLVDLQIGSSSTVDEGSSDSEGAMLVLRLAPRDDRGRFLQIVGTLEVRVVSVPNEGAPVLLATDRFDPLAVRAAWRGGIMGSGYVFKIPLEAVLETLPSTLDVVTIFTQAGSGRTFRDEAPVKVSLEGAS